MADIVKIPDTEMQSATVVNENYRQLNDKKWEVKYFDTAPTADDLNQGQLGVYDNGATRELYFKSQNDTLLKITATPA
jgi:hypothetical protein